MPVLVIAVILFALFLVMGVMALVAVLSETRGMPGSVLKFRRNRGALRCRFPVLGETLTRPYFSSLCGARHDLSDPAQP